MSDQDLLQKIIYFVITFATGVLLLYYPNEDIVKVCPDSNIWYLVLLHCLMYKSGVLIAFDIHAILDECNRKKLANSPLFIYLVTPYFAIAVLLLIGALGFVIHICIEYLCKTYPPQRVTDTETTALTV